MASYLTLNLHRVLHTVSIHHARSLLHLPPRLSDFQLMCTMRCPTLHIALIGLRLGCAIISVAQDWSAEKTHIPVSHPFHMAAERWCETVTPAARRDEAKMKTEVPQSIVRESTTRRITRARGTSIVRRDGSTTRRIKRTRVMSVTRRAGTPMRPLR